MSINLHLKAVAKEPVFLDDNEDPTNVMVCFLYQTPSSVSWAAVTEGADPYQVYADWMLSSCPSEDDVEWAQNHLKEVRYFLELAKEKGASVEWFAV